MSHVIERTEVDARTALSHRARSVPGLFSAAVLSGVAVLIALRWWERGTATPLSWQLPSAEALFLAPAAPVVGLLALRMLLGDRADRAAAEHLTTMASRWAAGLAAATFGWLVLTVVGIYGGTISQVLRADNLLVVASRSDAVLGQVTLLWVSLLVALFGDRLGSWRAALGLLVLTTAAVVNAAPVSTTITHGHEATGHPMVQVAAALQLVAFVAWLGALVAIAHLGSPAAPLRRHLTRLGHLLTTAVLVLGGSAVVASTVLPDEGTPVLLAAAQLAGVALVAAVGHRHRSRTAEMVTTGSRPLLAALVGAEVVVLVAAVMVAFLLPLAG
jgi:hypothetical protein